jgi:hypothetical protein
MKCRRPPFPIVLALILAGVTAATLPRAHAQAADQATARALFAEGRRLMKAGKYADACPKLEAAQKLYPSAGILLNLGDCYEKIGKTASAWNEFGEAASLAARSNRPEDADEARRRQEAIEPALVRLVIRVPSPISGLVVTRDGVKLAEATWGSTLPVDPGEHTVLAEADGHEPWSTSVTITRRGDTATVTVPKLKASPVSERPSGPERIPESRPATARSGGGGHGVALALLISGVVVGAGGGALMYVESVRASDARAKSDFSGYDATRTPWVIGLVGAVAGGLTAVGGVVLFAVGSSDSESAATSASAWIAPGGGGIRLSGSW